MRNNNSRQGLREKDNCNTYSVQNRFDEYGMSVLDIIFQDLFEPVLRAGLDRLRKIAVYNIETSTFGFPMKENPNEVNENDFQEQDLKELS